MGLFKNLLFLILIGLSQSAFAQEKETFENAGWQKRDSMITTLYQGGAYQVVGTMIDEAYNAEKSKSEASEALAVFSLWQGIKNMTEENYEEATKYLDESIATFQKIPESKSGRYLDALLNMADLQSQLQNTDQHLAYLDQALTFMQENPAENKTLYHNTLLQTIDAAIGYGMYDPAQEYGRRSLRFAQDSFSNQSDEYFQSLVAVGKIYLAQGETRRASNLILQAYELAKKYLPSDNLNRIYYGNNAISILKSLGRYSTAEIIYEEILAFFEANSKFKSENLYPAVLDDLGSFHEELGHLDKAYEHYEKANVLFALRLDRTDPLYIKSQLNVGNILRKQQKYTEAEVYYKDALQHTLDLYGEKNWSEATLRDNLGTIYFELSQYDRALSERLKVSEIAEFVWGPNHQEFAYALLNLGKTYAKLGDVENAKTNLETAFTKLSQLFGENHFRVYDAATELATFYEPIDSKAALEKYQIAGQIAANTMRDILPLFATADRSELLDDFNKLVSRFSAFVLANQESLPTAIEVLENALINLKSAAQFPDLASISPYFVNPSVDLRKSYSEWQALRQKIVNTQAMTIAEQKEADQELEHLLDQIKNVRKQILPVFQSSWEKIRVDHTISQIKSRIGPNDAIIDFHELLNYNSLDHTYQNDGSYLVFITPGRSAKTQLLKIQLNKNTLETSQLNSQSNYYTQIWQPIEKEVINNEKLYICPDAFLHTVSFYSLPTSGNQLLIDQHEIRLLTDLSNLSNSEPQIATDRILIMGSPDSYATDSVGSQENIPSLLLKINPVDIAPGNIRSDEQISPRSSALTELNSVSSIFSKKKKTVEIKNAKSASKVNLHRSLENQKWPIIHLSVPGFAVISADTGTTLSNSFRCGLALSGAPTIWKNDSLSSNTIDDGLLTVAEIYNLRLNGVELLVLPSLEMSNGSSLYILKKSLLDSGTKNLIYTLWPISEADRISFFELFYKNLLKSGSINTAFTKTQVKFRKKTDPRVWGSIVLSQ